MVRGDRGDSGRLQRARYVVTTEKDAVRLEGGDEAAPPFHALAVAPIAAVMTEGGEMLDCHFGAAGRRAT